MLQWIRCKITGCKPANLIDTGDPMELWCQKKFLSEARLKEYAGKYPDRNLMIIQLLADHEMVTSEIRKDIGKSEENKDAETTDFITGIL